MWRTRNEVEEVALAKRWFGLLAACAVVWSACGETRDVGNRRNVLLILTEDQGAQMGSLGTPGL